MKINTRQSVVNRSPHPLRLRIHKSEFTSSLPLLLVILSLGLSAPPLSAAPIVLTDTFGRTITAELLSMEGDAVKIRREDGQEFTLSISSLISEDQIKIHHWHKAQKASKTSPAPANKANPSPENKPEPKPVLDPSRITLALSRFKGDTNTIAKFEGYSHKHEMWGYSFQVSNRHLYPLRKLQIQYNLYARTYTDSSTPAIVVGKINLPDIESNESQNVKTKMAEVCKRKGSYIENSAGELRGIRVKLFHEGKLVAEQILPTSLKDEVEWLSPGSTQASTPPAPHSNIIY
jgi:hypothetical protein